MDLRLEFEFDGVLLEKVPDGTAETPEAVAAMKDARGPALDRFAAGVISDVLTRIRHADDDKKRWRFVGTIRCAGREYRFGKE